MDTRWAAGELRDPPRDSLRHWGVAGPARPAAGCGRSPRGSWLSGCCSLAWRSPAGCPLSRPQLAVYTPEGECLASYSGYHDLLGIKAVAWSPSGQLLAMGDYEQVGLLGRQGLRNCTVS